MKLINCIQGSPEWFEARCGHVGSSTVADALSFLKRTKPNEEPRETAARRKLRMEVVAERLTERNTDHYVSDVMIHGMEKEPIARTEYELRTDLDVSIVGYVLHPDIPWAGASPDGLVGTEGAIEIKAPNTVTHLDYLMGGVVPEEYLPQCHWVLACTERKWLDFISFDDRLPKKYQLFVKRLMRDESVISAMNEGIRKFLAEVEETIAKLDAGEELLAEQLRDSIKLVRG